MRGRVSCLIVLTACVSVVHADPPSHEEAKAHVNRGITHYGAKRWEAAITEFQAAYALDPNPKILFAWAQSERLSGDCASAAQLYRRFLATHPPARQVAAAQRQIKKCQPARKSPKGQVAKKVEAPPATPVPEAHPEPKAVEAPELPPVADETLPPPPPQTEAEPSLAESASAESAARPSDVPAPAAWYRDVWGAVLCGAGVAAIGVGVALLVSSSSSETAAAQATTYDGYGSEIEDAQGKRTGGWVALGAGTALLAGGVVRYIVRARQIRQEQNALVSPWMGPASAGLRLSGSF